MQKKTQRAVQFEVTEQTRDALTTWIATAQVKPEQFLFPSRVSQSPHLSTRQYVQLLLRHTTLESTVSYLGIGVDDALEIARPRAGVKGSFKRQHP